MSGFLGELNGGSPNSVIRDWRPIFYPKDLHYESKVSVSYKTFSFFSKSNKIYFESVTILLYLIVQVYTDGERQTFRDRHV